MELVQLRLVRQIMEAGSLSKAAMRLNRAQSVVSRQLSALEKECGGRIFYRNGRGVELTELGQRVLPEIDVALAAAQSISGAGAAVRDEIAGTVRLGVIPSVGRNLITPLFFALRDKHPALRLRMLEGYSGDLDADLEEDRIDLAVLLRTGTTVGRDDHVIGEWNSFLVGLPNAPAVQEPTIAFAALEPLPLLLPAAPNASRDSIGEIALSHGITLNVVAEVNAPIPTSGLVHSGAGYLIAPFGIGKAADMSWVGEEVRAGKLKASQIVSPSLVRTLVVSTGTLPKRSTEIVLREVIASLRAIASA